MKCCGFTKSHLSKPSKLVVLVSFIALMMLAFVGLKSFDPQRDSTNMSIENRSIGSNMQETDFISTSQIELDDHSSVKDSTSQPLLPEDRPEWVAQSDQVEQEIHHIAIATELASSIDECRNKLDEALVDGVRRYVGEHLSKNQEVASKLADLNASWIRTHLMKSNIQFDATLERPAGTYHQLWVQLEINPESRKTIDEWIARTETKTRAAAVGLMGGGFVVCLSLINVGLRFFAKKI